MKRILLSLVFLMSALLPSSAQKRFYLLPEFSEGKITFIGSPREDNILLNIDAYGQKIYYYKDDVLMELLNMNMIKALEVGGRNFIFKDGMLCEIIERETGIVFVNWKFKNVNVGSRGALGATTQAKVEVLRTYDLDAAYTLQNFGRYAEQDAHSLEIWKQKSDNTYFFSIAGTEYKVKQLKDLYKAFPSQSKDLKAYVKAEKLTMKNADDALKVIDKLRSLLAAE